MLSEVCENFFEGIENDIPEVKLMKYRFFLNIHKEDALSIKPKMVKIALDHELIGEVEMIHEVTKTSIEADEVYKKHRQIMSSTTIKLINESVNLQSVNNIDNLAPCYKNIADTYFKYAEYKEAFNYYKKLFRLDDRPIKNEQFFTKMALSAYYQDDFGELNMFSKTQIDKNIKRNLVDLCIINDLKAIEMNPQADNIFSTIKELDFSTQQIMQNRAISFVDIGFLYSLLAVAFQKREAMSEDVKWSAKVENLYLRKNYKKLLQIIAVEKKKRCYHSLFHKIYAKCEEQIRQRVLLEVISCYDRCPYDILKKTTGISEGQVLLIMKKDHYFPLLNDPVSQSFVYERKSIALYRQILKLQSYLNNKYEEEVKRALRLSEDEDLEIGGMGGMGGMGGGKRKGGGMGFGRRHH